MTGQCDNKSVGVIIRDHDKILLIERKNYPVAYACVAGHLDGDSPLDAAVKETGEEVGLHVEPARFVERVAFLKLQNPCKRDGGLAHEWFVYEVETPGAIPRAGSDAREAKWTTPTQLSALTKRTESIARKHGIDIEDLARSTPTINADQEWSADPGLEPVWVVLFRQLRL